MYVAYWFLAESPAVDSELSKLEQLLALANGNPIMGWGLAGFAVLVMATAAIASWTGNLGTILDFIEKYILRNRAELTEEQSQKLLKQLNAIALKEVTERLKKSLHHRIRLDVRREEQRQRVGQRDRPPLPDEPESVGLISRLFKSFKSAPTAAATKPQQSTLELFCRDDVNGRLLILGEPGAGKTNELLALAQELLQEALESENQPIPVIFELSEWMNAPAQGLADWLIQQLQEKYAIAPHVTQRWVDENRLLPMLDGLDELRRVDSEEDATPDEVDRQRQARQIQCMRSINTILDVHPSMQMVVCCRRQEYEALEQEGEKLTELQGAIYLQPLTDEQIKEYFQQTNRLPLWESIVRQPDLLELARSPLFLLMLVVSYQGQDIHGKDQLLDFYIDRQLADLNNQGAYPPSKSPTPEQTHHYLGWLATQLEKRETTEFLIEQLQPSWLDRGRDRNLYVWKILLINWLILVFVSGTALAVPINNVVFGLLAAGMISSVVLFQTGWLVWEGDIDLSERRVFSWNIFILFVQLGLKGGLFLGAFAAFASLFAGLMDGVMVGGIVELIILFVLGVIAGLIAGLMLGLIVGVMFAIEGVESPIWEKRIPNQSIKYALRSGVRLGFITGGIFGSLIGWNFGWVTGLIFSLIVGSMAGMVAGIETVIQHTVLRFVLWRFGVAPWNYDRFLQHAENHRFIQRVGGRYRFVHDLLRKRFAARYSRERAG